MNRDDENDYDALQEQAEFADAVCPCGQPLALDGVCDACFLAAEEEDE